MLEKGFEGLKPEVKMSEAFGNPAICSKGSVSNFLETWWVGWGLVLDWGDRSDVYLEQQNSQISKIEIKRELATYSLQVSDSDCHVQSNFFKDPTNCQFKTFYCYHP